MKIRKDGIVETQEVSDSTVINKFSAIFPYSVDVSASGDHEVAAPSSGKRLRVLWLNDQATAALGEGVVECKWKFATTTGGPETYKYLHELTGSQPFAHGLVWEGAVNEKLYVNTSSAARVLANADVREF